jgi:cupin 2 domain-containing protein
MPNIFSKIPEKLHKELFEEIARGGSFKLQRIVSKGHATPKGEWYDQDKDEWVILLKGKAGIVMDGKKGVITLEPGDYLSLPAHQKHRVEWTDPEAETVWLALHYESDAR